MEGEDLIKADAKGAGDAEGQVKGRKVLAILDGKDGLSGDAHPVGQILLGHLLRVKTQTTDPVFDAARGNRHLKRRAGRGPVWLRP